MILDDATALKCSACGCSFDGMTIHRGSGYIYILSNHCMPGLLKIGFTDRNVVARAKELSASSGVPAPYEIEATFPAVDAASAEAAIHECLVETRLPGREFFRISIEEAVRVASAVCEMAPNFLRKGNSPDMGSSTPSVIKRWLKCRTCAHEWSIPENFIDPPCPECGWPISKRLRNRPAT